MADSDPELDDGDGPSMGTQMASRPKGREKARWEASANSKLAYQEAAGGSIEDVLGGREEAAKRKRLTKDTTPLQRGIIRHLVLLLDFSEAMMEKDLRPTRYLLTLTYAKAFVREFIEQNPISQLGIVGMKDGLAIRVSDMSGNPEDHIKILNEYAKKEPTGNPSLQNGLDMARAALYHTPSHGTREVLVVMGALLTSDPGDIHDTIKACIKDRIRVSIIGLAAQMHICAEICRKTNQGDESCYNVAIDDVDFRELLMKSTTPPVMRSTDADALRLNQANLLMMGFPSRIVEDKATLCACHGQLTRGGYLCSRCGAKVCSLPATCPTCDLTLILSTHLARSYHHLFPLQNWVEVSWDRARRKGSVQCYGCLAGFPRVPVEYETTQLEVRDKPRRRRAEGASESSRYECETCQNHFCIDCDVAAHEMIHNCPGCMSNAHLPEAEGTNGTKP
ncbi:hypothetical protein DOTSEDRAFT_69968 [Dothistroma septosporum NZE10]|uniref:General transcription and DNA repair factor IIH n=1 Tax=Dothistroma septosporum (strain NZE10 / CBS 128990) TaxID=675120 RepID=N1PYY1_DOTSN|nr:hypothetical protein DOTSEDRAFT_69968 [Dothistroma septosporum NZE10]